MRRFVPSQVVEFIDTAFQQFLTRVDSGQSATIATIAEQLARIPDELITLRGEEYNLFLVVTREIEKAVELWNRGQNQFRLAGVPGFTNEHSLSVLRRLLAACPDEAPSASTQELPFIDDEEFRQSLRADLTAVERAFANGEWKAATVLAGSVLEALLLWALQGQSETEVEHTRKEFNSETDSRLLEKDPNRWSLEGYIEVSVALGMVSEETASQARLAKGFRNLIHPGRARRLETTCTRATALSALAAVEHVVEDLNAAALG